MLKRCAAALAFLFISLTVTSCALKDPDADLEPTTRIPASFASSPDDSGRPDLNASFPLPGLPNSSEVSIVMEEQTYEGDNIVEVPAFAPAEGNSALTKLNGQMAALAADAGDYLGASSAGWMELRAYPFTSDAYLQVVMTRNHYPNYGSAGEISSFVYNRATGEAVSLATALSQHDLRAASLSVQFSQAGILGSNQVFVSYTPAAFRFTDDGLELFAVVTFTQDGDTFSMLCRYLSATGVFSEADPSALYAANVPDVMDPPLAYAR